MVHNPFLANHVGDAGSPFLDPEGLKVLLEQLLVLHVEELEHRSTNAGNFFRVQLLQLPICNPVTVNKQRLRNLRGILSNPLPTGLQYLRHHGDRFVKSDQLLARRVAVANMVNVPLRPLEWTPHDGHRDDRWA